MPARPKVRGLCGQHIVIRCMDHSVARDCDQGIPAMRGAVLLSLRIEIAHCLVCLTQCARICVSCVCGEWVSLRVWCVVPSLPRYASLPPNWHPSRARAQHPDRLKNRVWKWMGLACKRYTTSNVLVLIGNQIGNLDIGAAVSLWLYIYICSQSDPLETRTHTWHKHIYTRVQRLVRARDGYARECVLKSITRGSRSIAA